MLQTFSWIISMYYFKHNTVIRPLLQLQEGKEKKRLDLMERKKENQRLLDEENAQLRGKSQKEAASSGKVTRAQIEEVLQKEQLQQEEQMLKPNGRPMRDFGNRLVIVSVKIEWESKYNLLTLTWSKEISFSTKPPSSCLNQTSFHRKEPPGNSSGGER